MGIKETNKLPVILFTLSIIGIVYFEFKGEENTSLVSGSVTILIGSILMMIYAFSKK